MSEVTWPSSTKPSTGCAAAWPHARRSSDITSANIFESILADEESHMDYLETKLELSARLGEPFYIAGLIEQPATEGGRPGRTVEVHDLVPRGHEACRTSPSVQIT